MAGAIGNVLPEIPANVDDDAEVDIRTVRDIDREALRYCPVMTQDCEIFAERKVLVRIEKTVNPFLFYFHQYSTYKDLIEMERQMKIYYDEHPEVAQPQLDETPVKENDVYGFYSKAKKRWVRALKDLPCEDLHGYTVLLIDYSQREYVEAKEKRLRHLPGEFCELSAQGFQAYLYVSPRHRNRQWTEVENCSFREILLHKKINLFSVGPIVNIGDHPYFPRLVVMLQLDKPHNNSWFLGGMHPIGTELMRVQKAKCEVVRASKTEFAKFE